MYAPSDITLYGYQGSISHWLRIVPNGGGCFVTTSTTSDGLSGSVIETVDLNMFTTYASFGYSPYIEVLLSGYNCGLQSHEMFHRELITQALCRSYETRAKALLEMADRKSHSIITRSGERSHELMAELDAVLGLWQSILDTGNLMPNKVLLRPLRSMSFDLSRKSIDECKQWMEELQARMLKGRYVQIPYKMSPSMQQAFTTAWS